MTESGFKIRNSKSETQHSEKVIYLRERNFNMLKKELVFRSPLRLMGHETEDILSPGEFGAVLARAGLGKTSTLVQLALDSMLRGKKVLHISLTDPVKKVCLWYEEVFRNIANQNNIQQTEQVWEDILPNRLIMASNMESFSVSGLEKRLDDLTEQGIFQPHKLLIDGLLFDETDREMLIGLKSLAKDRGIHFWFTVRTHRHETPGPDGIPPPLLNIDDLFDVVFQLLPEKKEIHLRTVKGGPSDTDRPSLLLDPSTMLIVG